MAMDTGKRNARGISFKAKVFNMVSVGVIDEPINRLYDAISIIALALNLFAAFAITFEYMRAHFSGPLFVIEAATTFFFAVDYVLRIFTATELYKGDPEFRAIQKYVFSFSGIIDLISFLPYYLPGFFPAGAAAFRLLRVARILRLFRINAYYDQLNVITEVLNSKKQQLMASFFIILTLMMASSLLMYSVEHDAQPESFRNAFSGLWWAVSALLTVGYGDIAPITPIGRILAIIISFLGVGLVAIPTGIISAGFVEQYQRLKTMGEFAEEENLHFIRIKLTEKDSWNGKMIKDLGLPKDIIIVSVERNRQTMIPRGDAMLKAGDLVVLCAERSKDVEPIELKEIVINEGHSWNQKAIRDLDISRQSYIFLVRRDKKAILPRGSLVLKQGDIVLIYGKNRIHT